MSRGVLFNIQFGAPQSCYQMSSLEGLLILGRYNQLIVPVHLNVITGEEISSGIICKSYSLVKIPHLNYMKCAIHDFSFVFNSNINGQTLFLYDTRLQNLVALTSFNI